MNPSLGFLDQSCQAQLDQEFTFNAHTPRMDLAKWVLAARQHKKLTQTQLGELVGVGKQNVSAWENGRHEPSLKQLLKIEKETGFRLLPETQGSKRTDPPPPPAVNFADKKTLSESEWALLNDLREVPEVDREQIRRELHEKAERYRAYAREIIGRINGKKKA